MQIRAGVRENRLRDPFRVTVNEVRSYVDNYEIFVWVEDQKIVGFSVADARNGNIFGLFVEEGHEGRGIGRALFEACVRCPRRGWLSAHEADDLAGHTRRTILP
jgi:GNAT superfamily N-acetyltransferase